MDQPETRREPAATLVDRWSQLYRWLRSVSPWSAADWAVLAGLTVLGFGLRLFHYTTAPHFHDNPDEVQFAWAGLSLLAHGRPESWSYFPEYAHQTWFVLPDGYFFPLVQPWLDHPPLFPLLTGAVSWLLGERQFAQITAASVRLLPIWLGVLSILLVYVLARRLLGRGPALVGSVLFAIAPGAVLFSRSVEPEAVLAVLLLIALLFTHRLLSGEGGRAAMAMILVCCGLAPLAKVPGVAIAGIVALILLSEGRWRFALATVAAGAAGLALFALYGAAQDWNLFVRVFQEQAAHRSGVMGAFEFIIEPAGLARRFRDPWWLLGWIGIGALLVRRDRASAQFLAWPSLAYAAAMLVMADDRVTAFGWYRITVYPLVYLAAGYVVWRVITAPSLAGMTLILITGAAAAASAWVGGPSYLGIASGTLAAIVMAAILIPMVLPVRRQTLALIATAAVLALVLVGNLAVSLQLDRLYLQL